MSRIKTSCFHSSVERQFGCTFGAFAKHMVVRRNQITAILSDSVEGFAGRLWTLLEYRSSVGDLVMEDVVVVVDAIFGTFES